MVQGPWDRVKALRHGHLLPLTRAKTRSKMLNVALKRKLDSVPLNRRSKAGYLESIGVHWPCTGDNRHQTGVQAVSPH